MFLVTYFNCSSDKGDYPREWAEAIIVPIDQKGNADLPDNYRGVSLLSVISKCYAFILNKRFYTWLQEKNKIVEEQAGFRKTYSIIDHIFALNAFLQRYLEKRRAKCTLLLWLSYSIRLSMTL